ncbi:hypothetical protein EYF80_066563 [Liparis tanakae]|uniref:Uncharacterized protein n=1 Tax=Liparis tanakae TaxID=230148 RepID=A0A4Z2E3M6_9TELE|nr:hypothetical protein EYF80_066563 [Liparis tanakae]
MHIHSVGRVRAGDREEMWEELSPGGVATEPRSRCGQRPVTARDLRDGEAGGGCSTPRNTEFPERINSFL